MILTCLKAVRLISKGTQRRVEGNAVGGGVRAGKEDLILYGGRACLSICKGNHPSTWVGGRVHFYGRGSGEILGKVPNSRTS